MTTKLTLSIKEDKLKKIRSIARRRKKSISKMLEEYIDDLSRQEANAGKKSVIEELRGAFGSVPKNWDWKKEKMKILEEKYGK